MHEVHDGKKKGVNGDSYQRGCNSRGERALVPYVCSKEGEEEDEEEEESAVNL